MEIVLGVDNLVFLAILCDRLPKHQQAIGRRIGLAGAMIMRILLLLVIDFIAGLKKPLFEWNAAGILIDPSWRDIILFAGGLILIAKATIEIGHMVSDPDDEHSNHGIKRAVSSLSMVFAAPVSTFVQRRPSVKLLALAFLVLIGFTLVLDGSGVNVPKGYIYFAMGFALVVEALNIWRRKRSRKASQSTRLSP